jgi:histidyl-tRNA synthetase
MKFQPVKGMRDFLPREAILREEVFEKVKKVFERFGFSPAVTPSLEYYEIFANKYAIGEENLKNIYDFEDKSGRKLALRFDQTVPLARLVACNPQLPKPFKRYEISRVWRYEEIKRGRYREFWQCDIDIVGSKSMIADAEVIACGLEVVKELGFDDVSVRINNRKLLTAMVKFVGVEEKESQVLRIIDKLDKIGESGVQKELKSVGLNSDQIKSVFKIIGLKSQVIDKIDFLEKYPEGVEGINELKKLMEYLDVFVDKKYYFIDLSLARGLDYYTSTIFEISAKDKSIGSIAGGGRYDKMIGKFSGKEDIPAVGIAIGIERILDLMKDKAKNSTVTQIFVACVNEINRKDVIKVAKFLREKGINVEIDLMERNLSKQMEYANKIGVPFVLIVGEEEVKSGKYKLKDMTKGIEKLVKLDEVPRLVFPLP